MWTITKEFHFSAAHNLCNLPPEHPCTKLHGHNYVVKVFLKSGRLNDAGMVRDYHDLSMIREFIDEHFDHGNLNEFMENPTAEYIAQYLFQYFAGKFPEMFAIEVSETDKTNCRYEP